MVENRMSNRMGGMIFDILETNIAVSGGIVLLCLFEEKLRRRYGAGWMKLAWILLAVRLLIPYNFSAPFTGIRLLNYAGFEQEREASPESGMTGQKDSQTAIDGGQRKEGLAAEGSAEPNSSQTALGDGQRKEGLSTEDSAEQNSSQTAIDGGQRKEGLVAKGSAEQNGSQKEIASSELEKDAGQDSSLTAVAGVRPEGSAAEGSAGPGNIPFFYTALLIRIWAAGAAVSLAYFLSGYLVFYIGCKKSLRPVENARLLKEICRLQRKYSGRVKIMAYRSPAVSGPMITGLIRPRVILPVDAAAWNTEDLELIMAHELCHCRKKDLWLKMLMAAVCCIHWFNPLVHVMKRQFAYDMELACDGAVLEGRIEEERENYARVMLAFAGGRRGASVFSTGFGGSRKRMKMRIDHMMDTGTKRKGTLSMATAAILILAMGVIVSCGYKAGTGDRNAENGVTENDTAQNGVTENDTAKSDNTDGSALDDTIDSAADGTMEDAAGQNDFNYNHVYNDVIRYDQGSLYLAKADGIYCLQDGQGEEKLLYANAYEDYRSRGMEIDGRYLYFCGYAPAEKGDTATVYRMDLDTREVVDALAGFHPEYPDHLITNVSVYEGNLYVASGTASVRTGFALDENGQAVSQLDRQDPDFLYREYNEYMTAEMERLNTEYDSEEYWELTEAQNQRYQAVIDVASCRKLLGGRQVVSRYKDESLISIYLENEDGSYEYVCDTMGFPMIVTETGLYYPDISGEIRYADFETKQTAGFYRGKDNEPVELSLLTYDADYVYVLQNKNIGEDREGNLVTETYIVRVPRVGGEAQKVYRFREQVSMYGEKGWYRHCGVYAGRMYFDNRETCSLDPEENHMQAVNSGEPCEDAVEITRTARAFADAYFENDADALRGLLTEDFEGTAEMYPYPEQAGQIREAFIGGRGIPNENVDVGVTCHVFYKFEGHAETGEALAYLTMQMTKTEEGFRIKWYGTEL